MLVAAELKLLAARRMSSKTTRDRTTFVAAVHDRSGLYAKTPFLTSCEVALSATA